MAFIKNGDPQPVEIIKKEQLTEEQKETAEKLGKDTKSKKVKN